MFLVCRLYTFQFEYTEDDLLARREYGNGATTLYTYYDKSKRIKEVVNSLSDGTVLSRFNYTYDKMGRPISVFTPDGEWTLRYDKISQLIYWESQGHDLTISYDRNGNRIKTESNGEENGYAINNLNQYTQIKDKILTYDRNGNLVSETNQTTGETFQYQFDSENKIVAAIYDGDR